MLSQAASKQDAAVRARMSLRERIYAAWAHRPGRTCIELMRAGAAGIARARFGLVLRERIERVPAAVKVRSHASAKSLNVAQNFGFANELARFRHQEQEQL